MSWTTFLNNAVTRLATVTGVNKAERTASVDPERLVRIPRFPYAAVTDLGGAVDPFSGEIHERMMGITIIVFVPRGVSGEEASKSLGTIAEAVVEEFTHTREDSSIRLLADTDEVAEAVGEGELFMKSLVFEYDILR